MTCLWRADCRGCQACLAELYDDLDTFEVDLAEEELDDAACPEALPPQEM